MRHTLLSLATAFAMAVPSFSMAAYVSGPVTYDNSYIYSGTSQSLTYDADGSPYSTEEVLLICIDHRTNPPFVGWIDPAQFDTQAGASAIVGPLSAKGEGAKGEAAIYWLLDQYYVSHYKNGTIEQRRALQYALWEIGNDFDGTAASINTAAGLAKPDSEDITTIDPGSSPADFKTAYNALYTEMQKVLPTLGTTYRSSTYTMDLFRNRDPGYQNMVALIERAPSPPNPNVTTQPVPGLGQGALALLTAMLGLLGVARTRRR